MPTFVERTFPDRGIYSEKIISIFTWLRPILHSGYDLYLITTAIKRNCFPRVNKKKKPISNPLQQQLQKDKVHSQVHLKVITDAT